MAAPAAQKGPSSPHQIILNDLQYDRGRPPPIQTRHTYGGKMKILIIAGARPNFMKIAPIIRAIKTNAKTLHYKLVHTGQHYDAAMSRTFFAELGIPRPHYNLDVGSASHAVQTAAIMTRFEQVCLTEKPDWAVVVGDVNSTAACGLVAKKLHIGLAHVEAGLRSGDRRMPEEINRIVTDAISDLLFVTEKQGVDNLAREGHPESRVHFVGHVMIDNLLYQLDRLTSADLAQSNALKSRLPAKYACLTMHRPSNVDNKETLTKLLQCLSGLSARTPIVFPCHPRTRKRILEFGLDRHVRVQDPGLGVRENHEESLSETNASARKDREPRTVNTGVAVPPERRDPGHTDPHPPAREPAGLILTGPLGYMDFLNLYKDAAVVVTDSGGIQEETTALKKPCITIRESTERPITVDVGSNVVVGSDTQRLKTEFEKAVSGNWKQSAVPDLWDGRASERIVDVLRRSAS
ncbi:MAG: UDP-N-acetylglucosamine 2-epimerase (non-hydrolyzing) [Chitinivibrionales bacterium]|nr:UDP-N-acetylglucosamine 2-epimerase (non-hydrolyzing) [Chitinivibrionales bacterium]MBD3396321.1 UDP-N-acetylglucosamine 2-epimerase (non-hydrolyzing) [Chitinivibrionales bacterium]